MNGILLLDESIEAISKLPDKDAGALIKAIIKGDGNKLPPKADLVFPMIMGQVERSRALSEKNTINGKKGGRPRKNPEETQIKPTQNPTQSPNTNTNTNTNIYLQRSPKIQARYGFSTERMDVDYNELARQLREAAE